MAYSKALPTANFTIDDDYQTTLSGAITASTTAIPLTSLPTATEGTIIIEPDTANEEEIYYTSLGAGVVNCPSAANGRGINGTTAISHASGATVKMLPSRAAYEALKAGGAIDSEAIITRHFDVETIIAGWLDATTETWTYASATTFTVSGDKTSKYRAKTKLRLKQGGSYKYFYVVSSSYSAPNTTVTVKDGIDAATYTLANSAITDNYFSFEDLPDGFPANASYYDFCRVTKNADQSISNETETTITWTSETNDTNTMHSTSSSPENITIKTAGKYTIDVFLLFDNDPDDITQRSFTILCNGNFIGGGLATQTGADIDIPAVGSVTYQFAANDVITVKAYHQAGNSINVLSARTMMSVAMIP